MCRRKFGIQTHSQFLFTSKALVGGKKLVMPPNTPPLIVKKNHIWKYFKKYFHSQICQWVSEWRWRVMILQLHGLEWMGGYSKLTIQAAVGRVEDCEWTASQSSSHIMAMKFTSGRAFSRTHSSKPGNVSTSGMSAQGKFTIFQRLNNGEGSSTISKMGGTVSASFSLFHLG